MINIKVRLKNKTFWMMMIPMLFLLLQQVGALIGYQMDLSDTQQNVVDIVNTVFGILALLGIVVDPTTKGISDSERAMEYDEPN